MDTKIKNKKGIVLGITTAFAATSLIFGINLLDTNAKAQASIVTPLLTIKPGASIRIDEPTGIRFGVEVDESLLNTVNSGKDFKNDTGIIIVPEKTLTAIWDTDQWVEDIFSYLNTTYSKTKEDVSVRFTASNLKEVEGKNVITGAIVNLLENHYNWEYRAVAYVAQDGETFLYSAPSDTRTIGDVAYAALVDEKASFTEQQKATLQSIVDKAGHKLTHHPAKEGTIQEDGTIEYWTCDRCGKYFKDEKGKIEITKEETLAPLAFSIDNPNSYIKTKVNYVYDANEKCYKTNYGTDYTWEGPDSILTIRHEYIQYLKDNGVDELVIRATGASNKVAVAKGDKNATEIGKWGVNEGSYTLKLNEMAETPDFIDANGNVYLKIFAGNPTEIKVTLENIISNPLARIETGSPYTYNEVDKCYERDYPNDGWGDSSKFIIKKSYIDYLKKQGATKLMARATGLGNMDIAKADKGASTWATRGAVAYIEPIDLNNLPQDASKVDAEGNITFKIYSSTNSHFRVYITTDLDDLYNDFSTFDANNPTTFIKTKAPFLYNKEDNTYGYWAISNQKATGAYESPFIITKEYIDYLKSQNILNIKIHLVGQSGTASIDDKNEKLLSRNALETEYSIDLNNIPTEVLDGSGNIFVKVYCNADTFLKVSIILNTNA